MAYYDNEINIIKDFCDCKDENICLLNKNSKRLLQRIRNKDAWRHSNQKSDPPPDFYSDNYQLMMEVMRVDDHAFKDDKGKIINPHIQKENRTYKSIQNLFKKQGISFSGDIIVNTITDLPTEEDHSYSKYIKNFQRVLEKHNSSYSLYAKNHKNYELVYLILDESSQYIQVDNPSDKIVIAGKAVEARLHLSFLDKAFTDILKKSKADYFVWYMPYKHFNSKEIVKLPQVVIYSKDDLDVITTQKYNHSLMSSVEE
ncbi:hypothetical protein IKG45_02580 [Candidatus Saccharibacteria bacterium]|nr:hypothetical protein [Candidatus Saccharibacteria bacterium]